MFNKIELFMANENGNKGFFDKKNSKNSGGSDPKKPNGDFDWSKVIKTVFSWGAVIIAAVIIMQFMKTGSTNATEVTFDVYENFLRSDKIAEADIVKTDINDYAFEGTLKSEERIMVIFLQLRA